MVHPYHESLLSQLYPGWQHSANALQPAVTTFEQLLRLPPERRQKVIWRLDAGFGGDKNVAWLVDNHYQVITKGASNRRAVKLASQVKRWRSLRPEQWVGLAPTPEPFARPVSTFVVRTQTTNGYRLAYLYTTLSWPTRRIITLYDQRGGAETEFRRDKSGGGLLHKRRKHKRDAQEVWIHLTDMSHNYWAWFTRSILSDSPFADYGPLRISRDLMHIPGRIEFQQGRLLSVKLSRATPHAAELLDCLKRFWQ